MTGNKGIVTSQSFPMTLIYHSSPVEKSVCRKIKERVITAAFLKKELVLLRRTCCSFEQKPFDVNPDNMPELRSSF